MPPVLGADFLAALAASAFLGAFPPVDLFAVCFVRAIQQMGFNFSRCLLSQIDSVVDGDRRVVSVVDGDFSGDSVVDDD